MEKITQVYILSGFLGSGKTTLLQRLLRFWQDKGLRPAVIMNEIGDVNLDGLLVPGEVPMAEMLGGCICCTIRGDLSVQMAELISAEKPDLVVIEATGAGNPLEIFDAVTEVSLYLKLEIKPMITVVDAAHLAELHDLQKGKTYRLMLEQIRCGSVLILNKIDMIGGGRQREMIDLLSKLNPYAQIVSTVKCEVDIPGLLSGGRSGSGGAISGLVMKRTTMGTGTNMGKYLNLYTSINMSTSTSTNWRTNTSTNTNIRTNTDTNMSINTSASMNVSTNLRHMTMSITITMTTITITITPILRMSMLPCIRTILTGRWTVKSSNGLLPSCRAKCTGAKAF